MSNRLKFTTIAAIRAYAQTRFPPDTAVSRMNASEKAYANVYNMTLANPPLSQLKQSLQATGGTIQSATRKKIYKFFAERVVVEIVVEVDDTISTLESVKQELSHILEQLQVMTPLAPSDTPMNDTEHEQWVRTHTEVGMLIDSAHNIALWLVPQEVMALLTAIDEQCTALYPEDADLTSEENRLYNAAKIDDNTRSETGLTYRQFLEGAVGDEEYSHYLDHAHDPRAEDI